MGYEKNLIKYLVLYFIIILIIFFSIVLVNVFDVDENIKNIVMSVGILVLVISSIGFRLFFAYLYDKKRKNLDMKNSDGDHV